MLDDGTPWDSVQEYRVWDEGANLVGLVLIQPDPEEDGAYVAHPALPFRMDVDMDDETGLTARAAKEAAMEMAEEFKRQAEHAYRIHTGQEPVGVLTDTGFAIQVVPEDWDEGDR